MGQSALHGLGILGGILALALLLSRVDFRHDLHRLDVRVLSGAPEGNYHAIVGRLGQAASERRGRVDNVASQGSVDNVKRLLAAAKSCEVQFALVQEGTDWQGGKGLSVVGRLTRPETVLLLGKGADKVNTFADLAGKKIGIGPEGGGTAAVARRLLGAPELAGLGVELSHHAVGEQLELATRGALDLVLMVMDEDAPLISAAVRERGLAVAGVPSAEALARRLPHMKLGRLAAGSYDLIKMLPPVDRSVLRVDTLVVSNGCAGRSQVIGLMAALGEVQPDFLRHNRAATNTSGLKLAPAAASFIESGGPEPLDQYVPWLADLMPPGNFAYVIMGISVLFNAMGAAHRFRLWRIDVARVSAEEHLTSIFPAGTTLGDISRMHPKGPLNPEIHERIIDVIRELEALAARSRRESLSMLVPMGQEMAYRYQEGLILKALGVLRAFLDRVGDGDDRIDAPLG